MEKEKFIAKWRKKLGCKHAGGVICWCDICCALEKMWFSGEGIVKIRSLKKIKEKVKLFSVKE